MIDWYFVSVIIFATILAAIFFIDRKNVKRESILLLRKTTRGKKFLIKLGTRFPRLWWLYGTLGVIIGLFMSCYMFIWILSLASQSMVTDVGAPIALVLPSPTMEMVTGPGVVGVPFWYWIISIALLVFVHEGSHGLMAAREKIRIKSLGWGLLAIIPLAFVEPDEKQLKKQKTMKQLRVFAAGSFANFITAFVMLFVMFFVMTSLFVPSGVAYRGLLEGYPAEQANLTGIIVGINNYEVTSLDDLSNILSNIGPEKRITIKTEVLAGNHYEENIFTLTTVEGVENKSRGFIGISELSNNLKLKNDTPYPELIYFFTGRSPDFHGLLFFIILINLGVGLFNLLPITILDGGRMWKILLDKAIPKYSNRIMKALGLSLFFILIFMLFNSFF